VAVTGMTGDAEWVITFDVVTARDRRALHRIWERFGVRVLHSVYEIRATRSGLDRAIRASADHVGRDGHLLALPWCPRCTVVAYGDAREDVPETLWQAW
jgi:CRISPR/Cas system-associated endoribonuclease Cas2